MLLPIEMRDEAKVVLESVPLDGHLFNFLMQRRNEARPSSHGNYMPAQEAAEKLLNKFSHGGCALNLLFLSDGRPSDCHTDARPRVARPRGAVHAIQQEIVLRVQALTQKFGRRLNVGTIGFAGAQQDFSVLERMAAAAKVFSVASYHSLSLSLSPSLSLSLSLSHTHTKTHTYTQLPFLPSLSHTLTSTQTHTHTHTHTHTTPLPSLPPRGDLQSFEDSVTGLLLSWARR